jgi:hypothetical protein
MDLLRDDAKLLSQVRNPRFVLCDQVSTKHFAYEAQVAYEFPDGGFRESTATAWRNEHFVVELLGDLHEVKAVAVELGNAFVEEAVIFQLLKFCRRA